MKLLLNPVAGRGRAGRLVGEVSAFLKAYGISPEWHVTEGVGHARRVVAGLPDDAVVVAVGGDGTVHEVADACVGTGRVMGVLPAGSGNDYVKALGIGTNVRRALEVLALGDVRVVDAGRVNGVGFNNGLGVGFDAEVAAGVEAAPTWLGGTGRYLWSLGRLLRGFRCHPARLEFDGGEVVETRTILVAAALGTTYGARFRFAPEARLDDGLFDVIWSDEVSLANVLRILPSALSGGLQRHPEIHFARTKRLRIELSEPVAAHVDGEMLPPTRDFEVEVLPGVLKVLAP